MNDHTIAAWAIVIFAELLLTAAALGEKRRAASDRPGPAHQGRHRQSSGRQESLSADHWRLGNGDPSPPRRSPGRDQAPAGAPPRRC